MQEASDRLGLLQEARDRLVIAGGQRQTRRTETDWG